LTRTDPTDHALAAIASLLDSKEASQLHFADAEPARADDTDVTEMDAPETSPATHIEPAMELDASEPATIAPASIEPAVIEPAEVDGYTRLGPGPLDAIRFRWTARRDESGQYFVDETIGNHGRAVSSGPMPSHDVIAFINAREKAARDRFDDLKRQMTIDRTAPPADTVADS
jgi:hypothetical protein